MWSGKASPKPHKEIYLALKFSNKHFAKYLLARTHFHLSLENNKKINKILEPIICSFVFCVDFSCMKGTMICLYYPFKGEA